MLKYHLVIPEKQIIPLSGDRIAIGQAPADFVRNHSRIHVPTAMVHGEHVQLYLFSSEVDAQHASLLLQADGGFAVQDERSQTGTFVNDAPVDSPTPLKQGDRLKIGPYEFFIYCESGLTPEPYSEDESSQFISCRRCGHEVLSTDERCPRCGDRAPAPNEEPVERTSAAENSQADNVPAQIALDQIAALHQTLNPAKTSKRYCARCRNWVLAIEQQVQNQLHGPIMLLLFWPWCIIWFVLNVFPSYRCMNCDRVTSFSEAVPLRWLNGRRIVFGSLCAIGLALLSPRVFEAQREQQAAKLFRQGLELLEEERQEEALTRFDRVLELVPNSTQAHYNRGLIHSRLGNDQQALDDFTAVIEDETEQTPASLKANAIHQRAHCFDRLGKTDIALANYTRSIDLEPDRAEFHACRGRFYASQNSVDAAISDFREALRLDPSNPHHWQALSFTLYSNERYEQASQIFTETIESDPSRPDAYRHRSYARMVLGEHELAVADLKEFLKFSPKDPDALRELGRCYLVLESEEEALEPLDAALEVTASDPDTFYLRAVTHAKLGHREQALADIKQAMSLVDPSAGNYELYSRFREALQAKEKILPGWQPQNVL